MEFLYAELRILAILTLPQKYQANLILDLSTTILVSIPLSPD